MVTASDIVDPVTLSISIKTASPQSLPTRRWTQSYARRLVFTDLIALIWTFFVAHVVVANRPQFSNDNAPYSLSWILVSVTIVCLWHASLTVAGTREPRVVGAGPSEYQRVVNASVSTFAFLAFFGYAFQLSVPRSYVLIAVPLGIILLILSRWSWRQWLLVNRQNGRMTTRAVAVGSESSMRELINTLHATPHAGYRIVGVCPTSPLIVSSINAIPVLGGVSEVVAHALDVGVEVIIVGASDAAHPDMVRRLGWDLEGHDIDLIVAPALANIAGPRVHIRPVAGLPLLHVERPAYQGAQRWAKALFDRLGSFALLVALAPIMVVAATVVKVTSRGPVFFTQERAGRHGDAFRMFKFRTMVDGAEDLLSKLDLKADAGGAFMFKVKADPRITPAGRFLRRFSIDELPQLVNVLLGDMSLVGPRPLFRSDVEKYHIDARRRLLVRPGITGLWQISGRSDLNWEETVRLDLYYVENWSMMGDLVILWRTARAVLSSRGAY